MKKSWLLWIGFVCLLLTHVLQAQPITSSPSKSIGEILNPDGTINMASKFEGR